MKKTGAALARFALEQLGVTHTFGIPGVHNTELYDELNASDSIQPVLSEAFSSSYSSVLCTPGIPKVWLTPNCSRAKRASAAPVFFMALFLVLMCSWHVLRWPARRGGH